MVSKGVVRLDRLTLHTSFATVCHTSKYTAATPHTTVPPCTWYDLQLRFINKLR